MNILALDQASKCGWACLIDGNITSGMHEFDLKRGESAGMRFLRFGAWLKEMHQIMQTVDLIVYEKPHHRGGAPTEISYGFITKIKEFASLYSCEMNSVHTSKLKKWATGNGRASKEDMIKAAQDRGHSPKTDDEADALLILHRAMWELNIKFTPVSPIPVGSKIDWNMHKPVSKTKLVRR